MTLKKWGEEGVASSDLNANLSASLRKGILNTIRQLQEGTIDFSADGGEWAEAYVDYVDYDGRLGSVDDEDISINGFYDHVNLAYGVSDFSGVAEDSGDVRVRKSAPYAGNNISIRLLETEGRRKRLTKIRVDVFAAGTLTCAIKNGTATSSPTIKTISETVVIGNNVIDVSNLGIILPANGNLVFTFAGVNTFYYDGAWSSSSNGITLSNPSDDNDDLVAYDTVPYAIVEFIDEGTDSSGLSTEITHTIPSGTFGSTSQTFFGTALVEEWEEGANIQYKLTNATEDTGYGDYNEVLKAASAFTSEPTKGIVKLIPKSSSPTLGIPSINGFGAVEWT